MKYKFTCVHLSDIHFRGLTRHTEYRNSFERFYKKVKKLKPDVIFIGGDIVHSKTQGISPELIDILSWWFKKLCELTSHVHVILGNHDGLILNPQRQDAISPIVRALGLENLHLHKYTGVDVCGIEGF